MLQFAPMNTREFLIAPIAYLAPEKAIDGLSAADAERHVTGVAHSVKELIQIAFGRVGLEWEKHVHQDPALLRPAEVDHLLGDACKAKTQLGWSPSVHFKQLVEMMVDADMERLGRSRG